MVKHKHILEPAWRTQLFWLDEFLKHSGLPFFSALLSHTWLNTQCVWKAHVSWKHFLLTQDSRTWRLWHSPIQNSPWFCGLFFFLLLGFLLDGGKLTSRPGTSLCPFAFRICLHLWKRASSIARIPGNCVGNSRLKADLCCNELVPKKSVVLCSNQNLLNSYLIQNYFTLKQILIFKFWISEKS